MSQLLVVAGTPAASSYVSFLGIPGNDSTGHFGTKCRKFVRSVHPNLRKRTDLKFSSVEALQPVDVLFAALPHGVAMGKMADLRQIAPIIIDLSADFRLRNENDYPQWYGHPHENPSLLGDFVYGIPELHREEIRQANLISSAG